MTRASDWIAGVAVAVGCAISLALFSRIPIYPVAVALLLPVTAVCGYAILRLVVRRSAPRHLQAPLLGIARHLLVFTICLHVLVVSNLAGVAWARALGPRAVVVLLGLLLIAAGNLLPRTRPNHAIGISTAPLLSDPDRWSRMHRLTGYVAVGLGCVIATAGILLSGPAIGTVVSTSAIAAMATLGFSYRRVTHGR